MRSYCSEYHNYIWGGEGNLVVQRLHPPVVELAVVQRTKKFSHRLSFHRSRKANTNNYWRGKVMGKVKISVHLASSAVTSEGFVHKSRCEMWCVCGCSCREDGCRVRDCYRGGIVVIDVNCRRLCVSLISDGVIY